MMKRIITRHSIVGLFFGLNFALPLYGGLCTSKETSSNEKIDYNKIFTEAVRQHNTRKAKNALSNGADPNTVIDQDPAIFKAVENKDFPMVMLLLQESTTAINSKNKKLGATPLMRAANSSAIAEALLKHTADPNLLDSYGRTALMMTKNSQIARLLINHGAWLELKDNDNQTALDRAALDNNLDTILDILLEAGANPFDISPNTAKLATNGVIKVKAKQRELNLKNFGVFEEEFYLQENTHKFPAEIMEIIKKYVASATPYDPKRDLSLPENNPQWDPKLDQNISLQQPQQQ